MGRATSQQVTAPPKSTRELLDHVGWDILHVGHLWKHRFYEKMAARGYPWFSEARARLLRYIDVNGITQAELVLSTDSTRQAVQQLLDELEADGIVVRRADAKDARRKTIELTPKGLAIIRDAREAKLEVEGEYKEILGEDRFNEFKDSLERLMRASRKSGPS